MGFPGVMVKEALNVTSMVNCQEEELIVSSEYYDQGGKTYLIEVMVA